MSRVFSRSKKHSADVEVDFAVSGEEERCLSDDGELRGDERKRKHSRGFGKRLRRKGARDRN